MDATSAATADASGSPPASASADASGLSRAASLPALSDSDSMAPLTAAMSSRMDSMAPLTAAMSSGMAPPGPLAPVLPTLSSSDRRALPISSICRPAARTLSVLADASLRAPSIPSPILAIMAALPRARSAHSEIFLDISSAPAGPSPPLPAGPAMESARAFSSSSSA